ncbi:MAG: M48 family metalloprotease [Burkholderiales bacterium]|nr:M48 family metalloprotease [Burkholderiales bacterium]
MSDHQRVDFFRNQKEARRRSAIFIIGLLIVVIGVLVLIAAIVWLFMLWSEGEKGKTTFLFLAAIIGMTMIGGCAIRFFELRRSGGASIAQHLGGEPVPQLNFDDFEQEMMFKRYINIAEEISIVSRVPMPSLYWLPNEKAINAFVAGLTHADAVLAVTRGALERLNRDELQGIIAHEFSHLLNGDMRLNTQTSSLLFGLHAIYVYGRAIIRFVRCPLGEFQDEKTVGFLFSPLLILFGATLKVLGYIGHLSGRILQAAALRQREYLADAFAVQFTRHVNGIAGALKKIYYDSSMIFSPEADNYNYFFFAEAVDLSCLLASHPPLVERIQALDGKFNPEDSIPARIDTALDVDTLHQTLPMCFSSDSRVGSAETFGMRDGVTLIFSYLLDEHDKSVRHRQIRLIEQDWEYDVAMQTNILFRKYRYDPVYRKLMRLRIFLVHLHKLSEPQRKRLKSTIVGLIAANQQISLLEAAIAYMVQHYLTDMNQPGKVKISGHVVYDSCREAIELLKILVRENRKNAPGQIALNGLSDGNPNAPDAQKLEEALDHLNGLSMEGKKRFFQELTQSCATSYLSEDQQEILSLVAVCLHAPPLDLLVDHVGNRFTLLPV